MTPEECNDLGSELDANSTIEICTGRKKPFPHTLNFKMHKKGTITPLQDQTNYMGIKSRKYNFFLGGTDSCQGIMFQYIIIYLMYNSYFQMV